jgi:hypothetical protein
VCFEPFLKLMGELIGNGKELRRIQNRIPDLADELESFWNAQFADLTDVRHEEIVLRALRCGELVAALLFAHADFPE